MPVQMIQAASLTTGNAVNTALDARCQGQPACEKLITSDRHYMMIVCHKLVHHVLAGPVQQHAGVPALC